MNALITAIAKRPVSVGMLTIAGIVFGVLGFLKLPVELLPDVSYPSLTIQTELEEASPEEVEQLLTWPVEEGVGVVGGLKRSFSSSRAGVSEVTLEFRWGTNMNAASLDVREKLDIVKLPDAALSPVVYRFDPSLDPIIRVALIGKLSARDLRSLAEGVVKKQLETLTGIAAARVVGGAEEEVLIELDPEKLSKLGLTIAQVAQRLGEENINRSGGELRSADTAFLLRTVKQFQNLEEIHRTIIVEQGDGGLVRLKDVGEARFAQRDREVRVRVEQQPAIEIHLYKEGDANAVQVAHTVRTKLEKLAEDRRLKGTKLVTLFDQAKFIEESVNNVQGTALLGALLAALVLYLFLRDIMSTFLITLTIPISVALTFLCMHLANISLNVMSLGGLALGIGMLVDNSVVVLEAIQRRKEEGCEQIEAVVRGTSEVFSGIAASTLTTICVFLPLVFVEGIAGQIFHDQALTVTFSLLASLLVAITLIPATLARKSGPIGRLWMKLATLVFLLLKPAMLGVQYLLDRIQSAYGASLNKSLRSPWLIPLFALAILSSVYPIVQKLGQELVPQLNQGDFFYELELSDGTPLESTDNKVSLMEQALEDLKNGSEQQDPLPIERYFASVGGSPVLGDLPAGDRQDHLARVHVSLVEGTSKEQEELVVKAIDQAFAKIPNCPVRLGRPSLFSFRDPIEVQVFSTRLEDLRPAVELVQSRLDKIDVLYDLESTVAQRTPEIHVKLNALKLASLGLTQEQVAQTLASQGIGEVPTQFTNSEKPIDMRVRVKGARRTTLAQAQQRSVKILNEDGKITVTPLEALGELTEARGPVAVQHVSGNRAATINGRVEGAALGVAVRSIEQELDQLRQENSLGQGVRVELSGQNEEMESSLNSLLLALGLAIFLVYLVLASTFESLRYPFIIILTVPLGLIGVTYSLWLCSMSLGVLSMIGVILLSGIVVNNGIIFVTRIQQLHSSGLDSRAAAEQAGRERLRPILITSVTTILGLLPMAFGFGAGAELRQPLAVTVIGGLSVATLLTLQLVPCGYVLLAPKKFDEAEESTE